MDQSYLSDFLQANNLFIQGHIDEAISLYSSLISVNPIYDAYINRSIAYQKKSDFEQSLVDSESAILQDPSRYEGFLNRGIANFNLGRYTGALIDFNEAKNKNAPAQMLSLWVSKCNLEIKLQEPANKSQGSIPHLVKIQEEPPKMQNSGEETIKTNEKEPQVDEKESQDKEKEEHFDLLKEKVFSSSGLLNYSWYQTDNHVGLEWDHKIESKELINHKFESKKISISFPIQGVQKPYELELNLWDEIVPETAKIIVTLTKVEVKFEKTNKKRNWTRLETEDKPKKILVQDIDKAPSYPSSSKYKKDWNKIDRELDEELSQDKDEDALNKVFKEIYKNADESTRRAMIKSFQTSGGTVL